MNDHETGEKAFSGKKIIVLVLCVAIIGAVGIYAIKNTSKNNAPVQETTNTAEEGSAYKTFSADDAYFTMEYPSTWVYEKRILSSGKNQFETFWFFYADKDKKDGRLSLNYPMFNTFHSGCVGYADPKDVQIEDFTTNDPKTVVRYTHCNIPGREDIVWQKGTTDPNNSSSADGEKGSNVRITWAETVSSDIVRHIAGSVKIIK